MAHIGSIRMSKISKAEKRELWTLGAIAVLLAGAHQGVGALAFHWAAKDIVSKFQIDAEQNIAKMNGGRLPVPAVRDTLMVRNYMSNIDQRLVSIDEVVATKRKHFPEVEFRPWLWTRGELGLPGKGVCLTASLRSKVVLFKRSVSIGCTEDETDESRLRAIRQKYPNSPAHVFREPRYRI
jgi:hypothetical protein